jgi:hypothetical protein
VLEATIASMRPRAVLAPAALGGHVDHILVRRVVSRILRTRDVPIAYYEDLPYAARIGAWQLVESILSFDARLKPLTVDITDQLTGKLRRLGLYKSQLGPAERSAVCRHSTLGTEPSSAYGRNGLSPQYWMECGCHSDRVAVLADHLVALAETEASLLGAALRPPERLAGALLKRNGTVITAHDYYDFLYRQIHGIEFVEVIDQLIDSSNRGVTDAIFV